MLWTNYMKKVLKSVPGQEKEYLSSDRADIDNNSDIPSEVLTTEFLNSLTTSGLPNHKIVLKIGVPIMLLRNIDQIQGLCNGTRLIITNLADHVIEAKIMSTNASGLKVYIPRMSLSPSQSPWPF
ncbi:hypothetical protein L6164_013492 [Bauhinia variegata]|uniref:Uncharacterized protein n=1 Tax=Bauhinia variegata TaxID=167791 RepID=A0ACB9NE79_BAUVA|nr:hypothetical protein L6164_013492 [Bauhinia variegata]